MHRIIRFIAFYLVIIGICLSFYGCIDINDSTPKGNGILMSPSSIEILKDNTVVVINKTDDKFTEIFELVKRDWDESLGRGLPIIIQWIYMNEEDVNNIHLEVRFIYNDPIKWTRGSVIIQSRIYSFFPIDNEYAAITADGEYEREAIILKFSPSDDLKNYLENYMG